MYIGKLRNILAKAVICFDICCPVERLELPIKLLWGYWFQAPSFSKDSVAYTCCCCSFGDSVDNVAVTSQLLVYYYTQLFKMFGNIVLRLRFERYARTLPLEKWN